jgi:tetratricopeptide (TPR) repeat protein
MEKIDKAERARELYESGKFQQAIPHLKELECQSEDSLEKAGYLLDEASCHAGSGDPVEAERCINSARKLVGADPLASAKIDFLAATLLIEDGQREQGLEALSKTLQDRCSWLESTEGQELYERIQIQRGFTLVHLSKGAEGCPILEEAIFFKSIDDETKSDVHCHLGRYCFEAREYRRAREHFLAAQKLGVSDEWEAIFHYYFGYTLYELKEFEAARRELILSCQAEPGGLPPSYKYKMLANICRKLGEYSRARLYDEMGRTD